MPGFRRLHKRPASAPYRSIASNHSHDDTTTGVKDEGGGFTAAITTNDDSNGGSGTSISPSKNVSSSSSSSTSHSLLPHIRSGGGGRGGGRKGRSKPAAAVGILALVAVSLLILLHGDRSRSSPENSWNFLVGGGKDRQRGGDVRREREDLPPGDARQKEPGVTTLRGRNSGAGRVFDPGLDGDGGGTRAGSEGKGAPLLEGEGGVGKDGEWRGGMAAAATVAVAEEQPPQAKPLSGTAKRCDDYQKDYAIVPDESWGSAPKRVQVEWSKLNCDRTLAMNGFSFQDPPTRGRDRAIVVVWNNIRGWLDFLRPSFASDARENCPTECVFTSDRSLLPQADGVLFHGPTFKKRDGFPKSKPPGADYVFINLEPSTYKPVEVLLRDQRFMSNFDLTMTYERSSDVPLGYVGSSSSSRYFDAPKASFKEKDGFGSPDAIAAFVSNCKAAGATERVKYMQELMKHATVHSFGYCLHNRDEPELVPGGGATNRQENKVVVLGRYKFLLAFENNNQLRDYVTEKVYNGLQSGTLPVYWGAENVEDFVPRGSVVKASDFSSPAELGKHLKMLAANEDAYEEYFKWRDDPEEEKRFEQNVLSRSAYGVNAMCRLCDRVLGRKEDERQ